MATVRETQQCFPKPIMLGDQMLGPAPEPDHERCQGGHTIPGVMGGWVCPCECHRVAHNDEDACAEKLPTIE